MHSAVLMLLVSSALFAGMLLALEVGHRFGRRHGTIDAPAGTAAIEGAVFALLGLLIAFSFSGAAARFDSRRGLVVEEANAIGTAYLRLDLLPAEAQPPLRNLFRQYLDARLETYRAVENPAAVKQALDGSTRLQGAIWTQAVAATSTGPSHAPMLLLPALNEMIDIVTTRVTAIQRHPPIITFAMLIVVALCCALLAGFDMAGSGSRPWAHMLALSAIIALTVYVIIDLEFPRLGLIRVNAFDRVLTDLRATMD